MRQGITLNYPQRELFTVVDTWLAGLRLKEIVMRLEAPAMRAELLLLAPSMLVPGLRHEGVDIDTHLRGLENLGQYESAPVPVADFFSSPSSPA